MQRRAALVGSLALALLAAPLASEAQKAGKFSRIGFILEALPSGVRTPVFINGFLRGLGELGYVEGQNLVIEQRSAEGRIERVPEIVAELVRLRVDVIVTTTNAVALRVKQATTTVPIVMGTSSTPVEVGLVQSLARPGGNVTGLTVDGGAESESKRLELLREAAPGISSGSLHR